VARFLSLFSLSALSGVVLTLVILPPPMYADSYYVWLAARLWPSIPSDFPVLHHAMRLGTVLPTRVAQTFLGVDQAAWVAAAALFAAMFTAGTYAVGRALFGDLIGLLAVGLMVIHPFFTRVDPYTLAVANSTGGLFPDMPAAGLFSLGVAALVVASRRTGRTQTRWLLGAGCCFGLAYLTREFAAFLFVAIPIFFLLLRLPQRRLVVPAAPMVLLLGFEFVANAIIYHDPFARLTVAGEHEAPRATPLTTTQVLLRFREAMQWDRLGIVFVVAFALTVVGAAVTRDRRFTLLVVWFLALWLPFTILGGLLDPSAPTLRTQLVRYWFLVFPPIVIGALATVQWLIGRLGKSQLQRAALLTPLLVVAAVLYVAPALGEVRHVHRDGDWAALRGWLGRHPEIGVLYTDTRTAQTARFYTSSTLGKVVWNGHLRLFQQRVAEVPEAQIGDNPYLQSKFGAMERPDPADGWRILWRSPNKVLTIWQHSGQRYPQ
jgi:hypothetical protein